MRLVKGRDEDDMPFQSARKCGDFRVTKHFVVTNLKKPLAKPNGYIIQLIEKRTYVITKCGDQWDKTNKGSSICEVGAPETLLINSDDIDKFTAGNAKYMTHNYLELFEVKDGEGKWDDTFQNGAVVKYEWDWDGPKKKRKMWHPIIEDVDESFFTRGKIIMTGSNIFIPASTNLKKMFKWDSRKSTPANGLPYLEVTPENLATIWAMRKSEPLVHSLEITWGYPGEGGNGTKIKVLSPIRGKSLERPKPVLIRKTLKARFTAPKSKPIIGLPNILPSITRSQALRPPEVLSLASLRRSTRRASRYSTRPRTRSVARSQAVALSSRPRTRAALATAAALGYLPPIAENAAGEANNNA